MVQGVPVLVRVFDEPEAQWMRARGAEPVLFHEASAHGLLEWAREESAELDRSLRVRLPAAPEGDAPRDGAPQPASAG